MFVLPVVLAAAALIAQPVAAYRSSFRLPVSTRSTTRLLNVAEHSSSFNKFKTALLETDFGYTIEELEELQTIVATSIERKKSRKNNTTSLHELCLITKDACDAVTPMLQGKYCYLNYE